MASVINAYSVSLGLDASNFIDGAKLTRSETRQLTRELEGIKTPAEKFAESLDKYDRALRSGQISQGEYNKLLKAATPASVGLAGALGPVAIAIGAVTAAATAGALAGVSFINWMRDTQNKIDDTADAAERLGLSFAEIGALKFGFEEGGGVDGATVESAISKLQVNIAKAVDGDQSLRDSFAKLGIDAGSLMADGPQQAMIKLAEGMERLPNHAERMAVSMELFGKSGVALASTLGKGADALRESLEFQDKWGKLTDAQVAGVGNLNDSIGRIAVIIEGVTNKVAAELAPAFQIVSDYMLQGAEGVDGIDIAIKNGVTTATILVGTFMDGLEVINELGKRWEAIHKLDFAAATASLDPGVLSLDKARDAYLQLEKNRAQAKLDGVEAAAKREAENQAREMEKTQEKIKAEADAQKKLADEEKRLREQAERENRKAAEDALKNAEKYFEDERKRQMKLREDVAKGPGAGIEAGSAEAARFMAEQANAAIAESAVQVDGKPTDEQLVEEAKKQLEFLQKDAATKDKKLDKLVETMKDNGWEAI